MAVTLKDIAQRAGVSVSTASRVINRDTVKPASPETAQRVWQAVLEMQYVPNQSARQLIQRSRSPEGAEALKHSIGVILASCQDSFTDPFFAEVMAGIQRETAARGYVMEYTFPVSPVTGVLDAALFNNIVTRKVDGAIVLGRLDEPLWELLRNNIPHLVYCGINHVPRPISQVICDGRQYTNTILDYLASLGHRRIGFIGEMNQDGRLINEWRYANYLQAMASHGLTVDEASVCEAELSMEGGYEGMNRLLDAGATATAYCCANDVTAIGAIRAILKRGLRVPQDISIIGLVNLSISQYITPPLTSIHVYKKEMGVRAVQTLIGQIEGSITVPETITMAYDLKERESCGPAPR